MTVSKSTDNILVHTTSQLRRGESRRNGLQCETKKTLLLLLHIPTTSEDTQNIWRHAGIFPLAETISIGFYRIVKKIAGSGTDQFLYTVYHIFYRVNMYSFLCIKYVLDYINQIHFPYYISSSFHSLYYNEEFYARKTTEF